MWFDDNFYSLTRFLQGELLMKGQKCGTITPGQERKCISWTPFYAMLSLGHLGNYDRFCILRRRSPGDTINRGLPTPFCYGYFKAAWCALCSFQRRTTFPFFGQLSLKHCFR